MQSMQINGADLLDGIAGKARQQERADFGAVSTGTDVKAQKTENWSKGEQISDVVYHKPQQEKEGGTVQDVMQQADDIDAQQMKQTMVVASHTTTATDCKQMEDDGFSLHQTDMKTVVTVVDKIKLELAKAGVDISYFGDGLSAEQIEAVTGNAAMAQELAGRIQQSDLPLTQENIQDCKKAVDEVKELHSLNDGALKYMLDNQLEPTIANLYKAQYSGSVLYSNQNAENIDFSDMGKQISKIIAQSGQEEDEQSIADSQWLIQNQVPLTADSLNYLTQLKSLQFPMNSQDVLDGIVTAIAEGKRPQDAVLIDDYSLAGQAQHAVDVVNQATDEDLAYVVSQGLPVTVENLEQAHNQIQAGALSVQEAEDVAQLIQSTANANPDDAVQADSDTADMQVATETGAIGTAEQAGNTGSSTDAGTGNDSSYHGQPPQYTDVQISLITARRQLEEVRLMMTVEASYNMLKQGISINTGSMVDLINRLKQLEDNFYKNLLTQGGIEATEKNVSLFAETTEKIEQLKYMPAYALGARDIQSTTLENLHQTGSGMQQDFQQANERYETMQTQVRKDLGDSIEKAFRNVDDILENLDMEKSAANERAVRILGYNHTEITPENIAKMKVADQQVQMAFRNLTPAVVREFIGRGMNPLDMDITELNRQAEQIKADLNIDAPQEKYSEYLYKLEQNNNITQEERNSYIGIYRLMNQIVQSDGAAIGSLVNQGTQITMRNLLASVRTERHGTFDVTVDSSFGELEKAGYRDSITEQIEAGYQNHCVKQALDEISPERFRIVASEADWDNLTPEQFLQQLQEAPEDTEAAESYYRQKLEDLTQCAKASEEVYHVLEQYDLPNTMMNVMAVSEFMRDRNSAYRRFFQMDNGRRPDKNISPDEYMSKNEDGSVEVDFDAIKLEMLERFSEDVKKPEELAKAMAELADCAEKCMSTMIIEPDVTSLDIRELKLMNAQISVGAKMASAECFSMPIVVDGEVTNVTLKVVRDKEQKGLVNITLETKNHGKIAAELKAKKEGISGYIATDSRQTRDLLLSEVDAISQAVRQEEDEPVDIHFIMSGNLDLNHFAGQSGQSEEVGSEEEREVQTKTLYHMAEGFIRILKQMDAA